MTATALPIIAAVGPYPALPVSAGSLDFVFTAADNVNGNSFVSTGRELLLVENTDAGAQTFTVTSVADSLLRTGDVGPYSMASGANALFVVAAQPGWKQTDGTVHVTASAATVKFAVVRLPSVP